MELTDKFQKCRAYPPVPNWYSSNATTIVEPNFFLYATRQTIVVLDLKELRYFNSFTASRDKITAIAGHDTFCFTAGVDKKVRLWNIMLGSLLATYDNHKAEVTALKLIRNGSVSISGDKSGRVVVINPFGKPQNSTQIKVKSEVTSIATTAVDGKEYAAVAYANGMIFVEEIGQDLSMTTVFQLSADNDPIQSLDWQKLPPSSDIGVWPLLASSTKRKKTIVVWKLPSQSKYTTAKLPAAPAQATEQQKSTVWIEVSWSPHQTNHLYFSSYIGHIHCFDLSKQNPKHSKNDKLERHSRSVFTIHWFNNGANCITTSLDNSIIKWDVHRKSCLQILRTQAAFPYSLDTPFWDQGQIAVGMGDNAIKVWSFSDTGRIMKNKKPHDYYTAAVLWRGMQGKIEKIKCHPTREGVVGYGNEYGHVGIYDTFNNKHVPMKAYHMSQTAPVIDWGGNLAGVLEEPEMTDTLLSVGGDGIIHIYDTNDPKGLPVNLNDRLKEKNGPWFVVLEGTDNHPRTLTMDSSNRFIAIGHTNGLVEVYDLSNLKIVFASNYQQQLIQSLVWKSIDGKLLLASACVGGVIAVYDISDVDLDNIPDVPIAENEPLYGLKCGKSDVSDLKWSDHTDQPILAAGTRDGFVIVWNVFNQTPVSLFDKHRGAILSVCWSQLDKDVLFTSSNDRFIYEWSYLDFPCNMDSIKTLAPLLDKEVQKFVEVTGDRKRKADDVDKRSDAAESKKKQKTPSKQGTTMLVSQVSEKHADGIQKERYCLQLANKLLPGQVEQAIATIRTTYLTETHLQDESLLTYAKLLTNDDAQQEREHYENIHELLYGDKNDIRRLVELEVAASEQQDATASDQVLFSVQNNIKHDMDKKLALDIMRSQFQMLEDSSIENMSNVYLSDWILLAFSPMVGKQKWIELMLKQAYKLEFLKQYHMSASCYMACSRVYDAVEVYRRHNMFREAIVLAKLRLPSQDPIVTSLFGDWAKELQKTTEYTLTATCYLLSNMPGSINNAIAALARHGEESALFSAACLATASDEPTKDQRIEQWLNKLNERLSRVETTT